QLAVGEQRHLRGAIASGPLGAAIWRLRAGTRAVPVAARLGARGGCRLGCRLFVDGLVDHIVDGIERGRRGRQPARLALGRVVATAYPATTRSRPVRLALRRARSARSTSAGIGSSGLFALATPTDTLTPGTPSSPRSRSRTAQRTRSPTSRATRGPGFRSSTANSSPPIRAGTSWSRTAEVIALATLRRTSSPAGWP